MDFMFDISGLTSDEEEFGSSKKDVLKYLKIIGVDTRFISYTPDKVYINNLRFSKFSRTREKTFNNQYPDILRIILIFFSNLLKIIKGTVFGTKTQY